MRRHMKRLGSRAFLFLLCTLFYCEFLVYYLVLWQCSYPTSSSTESTRAMVLADTHLLGSRKGHWFDKLRREWQMHRWECFIRRLVITGSSLLFQGVPDSPDVFQSSARILSWRPLWRGSLVPSRGVWVLCPKVPALVFHFNVNGNCTFSFSGSTLYFLLGKIPEFTWCLATMTWASIMLSVPI